MCGRFTLTDPERLRRTFGDRFRFEEFSEYRLPRFNIAPSQPVLGVRNDGRDTVERLAWGLDGRINARAETLRARPQRQRCAIFADGFYEWRERKPVYFQLRSGAPFAFAGVWSASGAAATCSIVTCEPNALVRDTHDRMPVVLADDGLAIWLDAESLPEAVMRPLLVPYAAAAMIARPVSSRVNDARYDAADILTNDDPVQERLL